MEQDVVDQQTISQLSDDELNEVVDKTPPSGPRRPILAVAVIATLGSLLFGYDTGVIAGALPFMNMAHEAGGLALTPLETGLVGGLLSLGAAFGAFFGGRLSDRYGRRHNIMVLACIFTLGAIGCSLSPNIWVLYICRFILGSAVGGASATVPVYLAESAPKEIRGPLVAVDQFMIVVGQFLAYSMNAILSRSTGGPRVQGSDGQWLDWDTAVTMNNMVIIGGNGNIWRWMLVLASIPAIALWIGIHFMPETSRWYASKHRYYEAIASLKRVRIEGRHDIHTEVKEIIELNREYENTAQVKLRQVLAKRWMRYVLFLGISVSVMDQLTGVNTAMYYLSTILHTAGFSSAESITLNVVTGAFSCIGAAIGIFLVSKLARRHVGMYQEAGIVVCLFALSMLFFFGINPYSQADGTISNAIPAVIPWMVLILVGLFLFFKQSGTVNWVLVSELFPSQARGCSQGAAVSCNWLSNAVVTAIFPLMIAHMGGAWTYLVFAVLNVFSFLFYAKILPETKFMSMEQIEEYMEKRYSK